MEGEIARSRHQRAIAQRARSRPTAWAIVAVVVSSLACGWLNPTDQGLAPLEQVPVAFSAPEMVTVRAGDTLGVLAKKHKVTVMDIRSWNGLVDETIEVDQVLLIWTPAPAPAKVVAAKPAPSLRATLEGVLGRTGISAPEPETTGGTPLPAPTVAGGTAVTAPSETPLEVPAEPEALPAGRVSIERPMLVGLLGLQTGEVDLEAAAAGMARHDADLGGGGLGDRSLSAGSNADDLVMAAPKTRNLGVQIPNTPVSAPRLTKPVPKRCLGGPSAVVGEDGVVMSAGLSVSQINAGMGQISRHVVRCFPSGTKGSYTVIVEITAGCDGRVSNVFMQNAGVVPANVSSCIQQTLSFASFPAHAVPNGIEFQYPLKFSF